jgi:hypothetical protein
MIDPLSELKNIRNMLDENGYLIVEVPNAEDIRQDPGNRYHKAHIYTFNPETLIALGEKAGFNIVRSKVGQFNGNISVIFEKNKTVGYIPPDLRYNYSRISKTLNYHNNIRHFLSSVPYKKAIKNCLVAIAEQITVRKHIDDKDIIDAVVGAKESPGFHEAWQKIFPLKRSWLTSSMVILIAVISVYFYYEYNNRCHVKSIVDEIQDGNDLFYAVSHPMLDAAINRGVLIRLTDISEVLYVDAEADRWGKDANFVVPFEFLPSMSNVINMLDLQIIEQVVIQGIRLVVLSDEDHNQPLIRPGRWGGPTTPATAALPSFLPSCCGRWPSVGRFEKSSAAIRSTASTAAENRTRIRLPC